MIRFAPIYQQRVWGGREMERLFGRALPQDGLPYGESWEICDRPEAQSIVSETSPEWSHLRGVSLHELWRNQRREIFGPCAPDTERFPLLIKILDARERLSLQVHPPQALAAALGGEPKTEMWCVVDAAPGASIYAGVNPGTTREAFRKALAGGSAENLVPELAASKGDFIFIPSGRLHAIGAGLVIYEIQQNSDTTYRVFDWNRLGLDGQPRQLHIEESLQCIDFTDDAPSMGMPDGDLLVDCPYFRVSMSTHPPGTDLPWGQPGDFSILAAISGSAHLGTASVRPGDFITIPATTSESARLLRAGPTGLQALHIGFSAA